MLPLISLPKPRMPTAGTFVKRKVMGIPVVALLGAYAVILMFVMFAIAFYNPVVVGPFNLVTSGTILVSLVIGIAIYFGMKAYNARRGLDISIGFREIPPE